MILLKIYLYKIETLPADLLLDFQCMMKSITKLKDVSSNANSLTCRGCMVTHDL